MIRLIYPSNFVRWLPEDMLPYDIKHMGEMPILGYYTSTSKETIVQHYHNQGIYMELQDETNSNS